MKLGPPPPPASPPVGPLMELRPLSPSCASEADRPLASFARAPAAGSLPAAAPAAHPHHPHHHAVRDHHLHHQAHFAPAPSGRPMSLHGRLTKLRFKRRKAGARGAGVEHAEVDEWDLGEVSDDYDVRRTRAAYALHADASQRDDSERGNRDEGHRLERHFAAIRNLTGVATGMAPARLDEQARLAALARALTGVVPSPALVSLLFQQARSIGGPVPAPRLSMFMVQAARAWLMSQGPGPAGGRQSLEDVKAALVAARSRMPLLPGQRGSDALVWLPVFLLNLDRPRTATQREQAVDRLQMLERILSRHAAR